MHRKTPMFLGLVAVFFVLVASGSTALGQLRWGSGHSHNHDSGSSGWGNCSSWIGLRAKLLENSYHNDHHNHHHHDHYNDNYYYPNNNSYNNQRYYYPNNNSYNNQQYYYPQQQYTQPTYAQPTYTQ